MRFQGIISFLPDVSDVWENYLRQALSLPQCLECANLPNPSISLSPFTQSYVLFLYSPYLTFSSQTILSGFFLISAWKPLIKVSNDLGWFIGHSFVLS